MNRCERDFEFQSTTMSSNEQIACPHNVNRLKGVKYTGEPIGKTLEFGGLSTYVSEPKSGEPRGILLLLSRCIWTLLHQQSIFTGLLCRKW